MSKHTPGKWEHADGAILAVETLHNGDYSEEWCEIVCDLPSYNPNDESLDIEFLDAQTEANAALIAAAPELLAMLKKVDGCLQEYIEFLDAEQFSNDDEVALLVDVQTLIAKAEGES